MVACESQDVLDNVENISSKFYPIIANLKSRNPEDILTHLEDRSDKIGKEKLWIERLSVSLAKVGGFLTGRVNLSGDQRQLAENFSSRLKEKHTQLQVRSFLVVNELFFNFFLNQIH
jgi:hypothetical protein